MLAADRSHAARNRAATLRFGALFAHLGDAEPGYLLGDDWTVAASLVATAASACTSFLAKPWGDPVYVGWRAFSSVGVA